MEALAGVATNELITQLAESQVRCEELEEELMLRGDELARYKELFEQFVDAWRSGRTTLKKPSFWARLFS